MEGKKDLRVVKTQEAIRRAFLGLLSEKPLQRITVSELTRAARVSKGTFYLHYHDIYDLYLHLVRDLLADLAEHVDAGLIFDDPAGFLDSLGCAIDSSRDAAEVLLGGMHRLFSQPILVEVFTERIYQTGLIERSEENDMRIEIALNAVFTTLPRSSQTAASGEVMLRGLGQSRRITSHKELPEKAETILAEVIEATIGKGRK